MSLNPTNLSFRGQRDGEEVILMIHRHPWALAKEALITGVMLLIIILVFVWLKFSTPSIWTAFILGSIAAAYAFHAWYIWWNNIYLVTNERVMIITYRALWLRRVEDYGLDKIQSLASETHGMAGALLNFGSVMMAVIGVKEPVALKYVEDAYAVQEKIQMAINKSDGKMSLNHYAEKPQRRV